MAFFGKMIDFRNHFKDINDLNLVFHYLEQAMTSGNIINNRILALNSGQYEKRELTNDIFTIEQSYHTRTSDDSFFESHIKYVDMQFTIAGEEIIEVENIRSLRSDSQYNEENDYIKYEVVENSSKIITRSGDLTVLFPHDGHMPAMQTQGIPQQIFKTVVKVPFSIFF